MGVHTGKLGAAGRVRKVMLQSPFDLLDANGTRVIETVVAVFASAARLQLAVDRKTLIAVLKARGNIASSEPRRAVRVGRH